MFDFSNLITTAILEIVLLMLVAAIIGFLIAWFYWRQKYKGLEAEFATYRGQAEEKEAKLRNDLQALGVQLDNCKNELEVTKKKLHALQMIQIKYDSLETKHNELNKDNATLQENYNALLTKNAGLGAQVRDLEKENNDQLTQITAANAEIKELKGELKGVKKELAEMTVDYGKKSTTNKKASGKKKSPTKKKRSKKEVLVEVASKRDTINYGLIGTAGEDEKQDLKVIKGIGPFIEQKLHALGIYTFAQIAKFDEDLIEKVTDALEAFPGRIQRDDWIGQAKELSK